MPTLHPRLTLDLTPRDLRHAVLACLRRPDAAREAEALERRWAPDGDGLACLSVRSAFDLYLGALELPRGSEVLMSGITIPDMVRVVREHGLVPVPVDLDARDLFPTPADCERAWSPNARVLVVAHLFGGRHDLGPILAWAARRGVRVLEDCAQGFVDPVERGAAGADASFYSFGTIKTMTALGGALVRVRDAGVLARMRAQHVAWPMQPVARYARKVRAAAALMAVQQPQVYGWIAMLCDLTGRDFDALVQGAVRGFPVPPGGTLLPLLRHRPCGALLSMLRHRLETFRPDRLVRRAAQGEQVLAALGRVAPVLGSRQPQRTHWLLAIESRDRQAAVRRGRMLRLDVAAGASSIAAVPRPAERPDLPPLEAERFMARIVFVPAQPEIPAAALLGVDAIERDDATAGAPRGSAATPARSPGRPAPGARSHPARPA